uniref:ATP synthase complex subunit 8 n=1 Tax=Psychodopygus squamiventris maripaensis TaxID=1807781 RepID=A0A343AW90_9DIPT|nr:ATP synthase F0 subunit 8 [Psychodopygus squamiventris maripaensis]
MPQMAPLMWLSLFIFFLMIYLLFNIINYFSYITLNKKSSDNKTLLKSESLWKW